MLYTFSSFFNEAVSRDIIEESFNSNSILEMGYVISTVNLTIQQRDGSIPFKEPYKVGTVVAPYSGLELTVKAHCSSVLIGDSSTKLIAPALISTRSMKALPSLYLRRNIMNSKVQ